MNDIKRRLKNELEEIENVAATWEHVFDAVLNYAIDIGLYDANMRTIRNSTSRIAYTATSSKKKVRDL